VHLEIKEILESTDVDLVVRTLEESVRALAKNVVRSEQQLIAFGIGPSPIAKNTRDRAVFNAAAVGTGTCVTVDVSYQASGLLGNLSQNDVVRDKILGVLQEARTGIRYRSGVGLLPPVEQRVEVPVAAEGTVVAPEPVARETAVEVPAVAASVVVPVAAPVTASVAAPVVAGPAVAEVVAVEPVGAEKIAVVPVTERVAVPVAAEIATVEVASPVGAVAGAAVAAPAESLPAAKVAAVQPAGSASGSRRAVLVLDDREEMNFVSEKALGFVSERTPLESYAEQHEAGGGVGRVVGWITVLALCAGGGWWSVNHPQKVAAAISVVATKVRQLTGGGTAAGETVSNKSDVGAVGTAEGGRTANGNVAGSDVAGSGAVRSDSAASDPVASNAAKVGEQDLNAWLLNWAEAMQSHDAEAQAAYYADPVVFYFRTPNVGHAALLESKRGATENKDPDTTLKIEKLKIMRQTADSGSVELVKHFVTRTARSGPVDLKVQSQLKVRRINGDWRIVEEHNLG
jgi:ketosteroid isomerase-like protein